MAIIRARDARARLREWRAQTRLRRNFERDLQRRMARIIADAGRDAADAFRAVGVVGVDISLSEHRADVQRALVASYTAVMDTFGARLLESAKSHHAALETKDTQDAFDVLVQQWISEVSARKVTQISRTTRNQIIDAIASGEADGLGVDPIARRIVDRTGGLIGRFRASLIARTETHSAANAAQTQALDALDIPQVRREWVAAEDERTRSTHNAADGQIRGQQEKFDVGGAKLAYPGDPVGPPEEIINCRCIAASVVED